MKTIHHPVGRVLAVKAGAARPAIQSTTDLGDANRARILEALTDNGPLSRAELARMAGVTRASIGGMVAGLIKEGTLQEQAPAAPQSRAGKPSKPLWFADHNVFGAVAIQPGHVDVAIVTASGTILHHTRIELRRDLTRRQFDKLVFTATLDVLQHNRPGLKSVGMSVPAVFDAAGELIASTTIPASVGSTVQGQLADALNVPVVLEDDARALALGQRWFGHARGQNTFIALQIGEGIGAGIMLDGTMHRGPMMVSEVGHMTVDLAGTECPCGLIGCWETIASTHWLRERAKQLNIRSRRPITARTLAELHDGDLPAATQLLDEYADHVSVGIVNLYHTLSIPVFTLHGEVVGAGSHFRERLTSHIDRRIMPGLKAKPEVRYAEEGTNWNVLGAAAAAITVTFGLTI